MNPKTGYAAISINGAAFPEDEDRSSNGNAAIDPVSFEILLTFSQPTPYGEKHSLSGLVPGRFIFLKKLERIACADHQSYNDQRSHDA